MYFWNLKKIFVAGGFDDNAPLSSVEVYDPVTSIWVNIKVMQETIFCLLTKACAGYAVSKGRSWTSATQWKIDRRWRTQRKVRSQFKIILSLLLLITIRHTHIQELNSVYFSTPITGGSNFKH